MCRPPHRLVLILALAASTAVFACEDEPEVEVDAEPILEALDGYDFYEHYVRVNDVPVVSQHGDARVYVWLEPELAEQYLAIDPMNRQAVSFPRGTLIIKEQLDEFDVPISATLLYKGPEGYNPEVGDWWFGTADLLTNELIEGGPDLPSCVDCHSSAATSDFVHGLPKGSP